MEGGGPGNCLSSFDVVGSFGRYLEVLGDKRTDNIVYMFPFLVITIATAMGVSTLIPKRSSRANMCKTFRIISSVNSHSR